MQQLQQQQATSSNHRHQQQQQERQEQVWEAGWGQEQLQEVEQVKMHQVQECLKS
jgi:sulfur transfer protein SufE